MLVLDDTAIAEAKLLHPIRGGYFTVAQRHAPDSNGKTWSQRGYAMSSLEQVLSAVRDIPDYYISQASFVTPRRGNATVQSLSCSFVDLDCYKLGLLPDDATVHAILVQAASFGLPAPSYVMSSGRGLYAKWIFDQPLSGTLIPHWKRLQDVLGSVFQSFGSDANARDLARVLRASSTMNSKSGSSVQVIHQTGNVYRFADLAAIAANLEISERVAQTKEKARQIRIKQDSLAAIPSDLGALMEYSDSREPVMMKAFSRQSLNWTRFIDIRDLMIRRGGAAKGSRDVLLFWMTAALGSSGVIDANNFWPEVQNLLRGFSVSQDFDPMNDGSLESLRKRIERHSRGEKVEFNGSKVSPIYTPSNDYLIDVLNITDEEQQQLKTIISGAEKQRRADLKAPGRAERRVARNENRAMAAQLKADGLPVAEIAQKIGVDSSTIRRWLAPAQKNKTRNHESYMSAKWEAQRIAEWLEKRKETQAERQRQYELMREQEAHLRAAQIAQTKLKTSAHLMSIFEKIQARDAEGKRNEELQVTVVTPLDPPKIDLSYLDGFVDVDAEDDDRSEVEYERPRM